MRRLTVPAGTSVDNLTTSRTERLRYDLDLHVDLTAIDDDGDVYFWHDECRYRVNITYCEG